MMHGNGSVFDCQEVMTLLLVGVLVFGGEDIPVVVLHVLYEFFTAES